MDEQHRGQTKVALGEGDKGLEPGWGKARDLLAPWRFGKEGCWHNETLTAKVGETSKRRVRTCLT